VVDIKKEIVLDYKYRLILHGTLHDFQPLTFFSKCFRSLEYIDIKKKIVLDWNTELVHYGTLHPLQPLTFFRKCFWF
jgi:hypothetical protein